MKGRKLLKGGVVVDYETDLCDRKEILIEDGVIADLIDPGDVPSEGDFEVVEIEGCHVIPGLVDIHVHLREPGFEWKEDIESGTRAAVAGGFTSVACMPNTDPVNDDPETTRFIIERAKSVGFARVYPIAAITRGLKGEELTDMGELIDAGAVAFSDDGRPVFDALVLSRALEYAKMFGVPLILHEEEPNLSKGGCVNEGKMSTILGLPGIPASSEICMVARDVSLAEYNGGRIHVAHVSTAGAVELIKTARERGVDVTAETAPHYLVLTEDAVDGFNTKAKMNPPLRTREDREALKKALMDGIIDCVATDHAPHEDLVKECEFDAAAFGVIGLQTAFPLTLKVIGEKGGSIKELVKVLSYNPAKILNIPGGKISRGAPADLAVVDLEESYVFTEEMVLSKSKNSPFLGMKMKGRVRMTLVGGETRFEDGRPVR